MRAVYVESSALLAWLFGEPASTSATRVLSEAEVVVTSSLTFTEVDRAIIRAVSERRLKEATARRLRGLLERQRSSWIVMSLTDNVLARAGRVFPVEPVRTLDAVHLASALAFCEALPDLEVLTLDRRVGENAIALGFALA